MPIGKISAKGQVVIPAEVVLKFTVGKAVKK